MEIERVGRKARDTERQKDRKRERDRMKKEGLS